jgi:REP element-mobilizing transposase RayT
VKLLATKPNSFGQNTPARDQLTSAYPDYLREMTRPLRLEFSGALYHVTSRGDRREPVYRDDHDRRHWLSIMGLVCKRFNFVVHAYCQMTNHYHLLVETVDGNLSQGMRQLNGLYTQGFNRRHRLVGHLFQGRYKAILVQRERYLLALTRYIVLNPVRAGMVASPDQWPWSNHQFVAGHSPARDTPKAQRRAAVLSLDEYEATAAN